jgi:hypothetical protein
VRRPALRLPRVCCGGLHISLLLCENPHFLLVYGAAYSAGSQRGLCGSVFCGWLCLKYIIFAGATLSYSTAATNVGL